MGLRNWWRQFIHKVQEILGIHSKYDDFCCEATMEDGGVATFTGRPWGPSFEMFKSYASMNAVEIRMNMGGSFWTFD